MELTIDLGSSAMRVGFSGDDAPHLIIPSVIGYPKYKPSDVFSTINIIRKDNFKEAYIGKEALGKLRGILSHSYPIQNGQVTNWDQLEIMWYYAFEQLNVDDLSNCSVMMVEPSSNLKSIRNQLSHMHFELFNVRGVSFGNSSVMAMYSAGITSGLVLDCGESSSRVMPIYESHVIPEGIGRLNVGGKSIDKYLAKMLNDRGLEFRSSSDLEIIREMKESIASCVKLKDNGIAQYELPDGQIIDISNEKYECVECLFNPDIIGITSNFGISDMLYNSILKCPIDTRSIMYTNILLNGGTTLSENFVKRLESELSNLIPSRIHYKIYAYPYRIYQSWIGASIVSSMGHMRPLCVSKEEYHEYGCSIIDRKCLLNW